MLFFISLVMSSLLAISAHSWLSAWISLEINLLSIIPLLKNPKNKFFSESTIKYFIVQTVGSSLLLFSLMTFLIQENSFIKQMNTVDIMLVSSALLLKMGAAPFHFWLPEMMSGLSWMNSFIIMTWQKLAPMILISYLTEKYLLFFSIIIIISSMISGLQGMNQVCLRKILAYSSINHTGWMMSTLLNSVNIFNYYFFIYCIINMNIIFILKKYNIFFLSQMSSIFNHKKKIKFLFMLNFMSLGGLPPFLGFLPKWLAINNMIENNHFTLAAMLIIFTLITLYFYLRMTFSSFTVYSEESLIIPFNKINYFHFLSNLFSLTGLITCSFMDSIL
uniref:NADH-ubiquinone oxidoreductase chain 2 n=1 Tax=Romualdius bifoveolatus TaxID=1342232 RepID=A0A343C3V9_9CUCU|nr:NADH dehydrogenase subunit 2 [Romualdius bifoveolatus]